MKLALEAQSEWLTKFGTQITPPSEWNHKRSADLPGFSER
jgi:hypothetical protein